MNGCARESLPKMFCDQCGTPLDESSNFCTHCGKRLTPAIPVPPVPQAPSLPSAPARSTGRVQHHLKLLAIFWLVYAAIRLVGVFWLYAVGRMFIPSFIGAIVSLSQPIGHDSPFGWLFSTSLAFIAIWIVFWSALQFIAAWGLFERAPWARLLVLVVAILSLLHFPLGTILGIYTLWVLLPAHSGAEYDLLARRA